MSPGRRSFLGRAVKKFALEIILEGEFCSSEPEGRIVP
jgi:hypothetical protein